MRTGLGLCVLGLMCLHTSVFGQEPEAVDLSPAVQMSCDDTSVEKAVYAAVSKYNENLSVGHKMVLFQILNVTKSEYRQNPVYRLRFSTRKSDCPAGSPKPWTECKYMPRHKKPIVCDAMVDVTMTEADKIKVHCQLEDHIIPEKMICLGCPLDMDLTSMELKGPLSACITKYNTDSPATHLFHFNSITHATRQVVAGFRYKLRFDLKKTICAKVEHKELTNICVPDDQDEEFVNCNATVIVAPWRLEPPQTHIVCEAGALPVMITRRHPAGWSPLRNILFDETPSSTTAPLVTPAAKEESSEEDTKALEVSSTNTDLYNTHFRCPSQPWKPLSSPVGTEATSPQLEGEQGLTDKDLLA